MFFLRWGVDDGSMSRIWWYYAVLGGLLLLAGVTIVLVPQILVALVAGLVMTAGAYLLGIGLQLRSLDQRQSRGGRVDLHVPRGDARFEHRFGGQSRDQGLFRW